MTSPPKPTIDASAPGELIRGEDALTALGRRAGDTALYLVGGSVRDSLLGERPLDLDVAVDGPVARIASDLDPDATLHERFDTAAVSFRGRRLDLARTRSEKYRRPGALPEVEPADIESDLSRRDFTINAMAIDLADPGTLIDPHGGAEDLGRGVIRVLHARSFVDDPTRALRAARYAARLGFDIDHRTADLLREVDLTTVSPERLRSELALISEEPGALEALRLVSAWGLIGISDEDLGLIAAAFSALELPAWQGFCSRTEIVDGVVGGSGPGEFRELIQYPGTPSRAVVLARRHDALQILLARAVGAEWLDDWISGWRGIELEITGDDLVDAGIEPGRAVGTGLDAAMEAALDNGVADRDGQLAVALEAARAAGGAEPGGRS